MTLKHLSIQNIILVENATIEFDEGFNIITGETGSGKSAILQALKLLSGDKFDSGVVRHGCEKGWTEASFDVEPSLALTTLISDSGLTWNSEDPLILRRELNANGKSRCFINNQLAQKNLLQEIASHLLHIVGQHASRELLQPEKHRHILDTFGNLGDKVTAFAKLYQTEKAVKKELEELLSSEKERLRTIETLQREVEELSQANLKEGEEEELFAEYTLLMNAENILQTSHEFTHLLQGDSKSILPLLTKAKKALEKLCAIVPALNETSQLLQNAEIELQEAAYSISQQLSHVDNNPKRAADVDERMSEIARLKRRYGNTVESMLNYLQDAQKKLTGLENSDETIAELQEKLQQIQQQQDILAQELTQLRKSAGKELAHKLTHELKQLNMPHVDIAISVEHTPRHSQGDDAVEFHLKPNVGEKMIPLRQCASGGELSRFLLALQYLLSKQGHAPTLIFDEIDSNIGGETASVVGKKLQGIGDQTQVICVSHFPQVAAQAHRHLCIAKKEINGRTHTTVRCLDQAQTQDELQRMAGGSLVCAGS